MVDVWAGLARDRGARARSGGVGWRVASFAPAAPVPCARTRKEVPIMTTQFTGKYVSLTTFRRDGTESRPRSGSSPKTGACLLETDGDSYKVKRIRRNENVTVASCNPMGRVTGDVVPALAAILPADELPRVERLLHRNIDSTHLRAADLSPGAAAARSALALREACGSFDHADIVLVTSPSPASSRPTANLRDPTSEARA